MAKYNGSIDLISGLRPKNNGTFPLMSAHDVQVNDDGDRLDGVLNSIYESSDSMGLSVVDGALCMTYEE